MARIDLIRSVLDCLSKNTNKAYVSCEQAINIVDVKVGMTWRDVFDIPNAIKFIDNEEQPDNEINGLINETWWDKGTTLEEKIKVISNTYTNERNEAIKLFKDFFKSKKLKPTDSVYDEFKGILKCTEVSNIHEFQVDGSNSSHRRNDDISRLYRVGRYGRNFEENDLGCLLYSLHLLPDWYISVKKMDRYEFNYYVVIYKKAKNLKLESNSVEALDIIEKSKDIATFYKVFHIKPKDYRWDSEYRYMDLLGKLHTASYRHESVNVLDELIDILNQEGNYSRFKSLVGLGKTSFTNRLIQYYLEDFNLDAEKDNYPWSLGKYTQEHIDEAINILENRYNSYVASQASKKEKNDKK